MVNGPEPSGPRTPNIARAAAPQGSNEGLRQATVAVLISSFAVERTAVTTKASGVSSSPLSVCVGSERDAWAGLVSTSGPSVMYEGPSPIRGKPFVGSVARARAGPENLD